MKKILVGGERGESEEKSSNGIDEKMGTRDMIGWCGEEGWMD